MLNNAKEYSQSNSLKSAINTSALSIDLPLPLPGFYNFFSSWLLDLGSKVIVVDPGPTASINHLVTQLKAHGIDRIDYLLLTHIHLDHAGGTGTLVKNFIVDKIFCHPKAIPHLVEPKQLWEGSVKTLGQTALVQGEPEGVPSNILYSSEELTSIDPDFSVIPSPGHAPHHVSYLINDILFIGEAVGVIIPEMPSYRRPATPHRFVLAPYVDSILRLKEVACKLLCFGHFGSLTYSKELFDESHAQILLWLDIIEKFYQNNTFSMKLPLEIQYPIDHPLIRLITEQDPLFSAFLKLPKAIQIRELEFVENTVQGIHSYLINLNSTKS